MAKWLEELAVLKLDAGLDPLESTHITSPGYVPRLKITLSRTADGEQDYMQIVSEDQFALNIVLISGAIEVADHRPPKPVTEAKRKAKGGK